MIKRLRAELPASILMNVGDTYHGGVEALYTQGEAIAPIVNALGIDVGVPGNWDYAYGPQVTRGRYTGDMLAGMQECIQLGFASGAIGGGGGGGIGGGGGPKGPMSDAGADSGSTSTSYLRPSFPNLAANVTYKTGPSVSPGDPFLPPTYVKEVSGVKVGFIGISSDIVPKMHPMLACGLTFLGADDLASGDSASWETKYRSLIEDQAKSLRAAGAAVVVVMSELGLQKDFHLGNLIAPNTVDVFFSAHTHESVFVPLASKSGALVVEAGDDTYLGHMDVRIVNSKVIERQWKLEPVTLDIAEDPAIKKLVDDARAPFLVADPNRLIPGNTGGQLALHEPIDSVVGHVPHPIDRKQALDSSFNDFFTEALRTAAGTQLGMAPGFRFDSPIATAESLVEGTVVADGAVTVEDTYRFFPVVYTMATASATGAQMKQVMERGMTAVFSTSVALQAGGWLEGFAGLKVQTNLAAPDGQRVLGMTLPDGTPIGDASTFSIAGCRRPFDATDVMCSQGGFTQVQDFKKSDGSVWTNVEILRSGLAAASQLKPVKVFSDTSGTKTWPQAAFVQPLEGATGK
jgi:2',3'-cyclic-nucleotide 2'-phosphodiesterase (5'-nucleotidase family)